VKILLRSDNKDGRYKDIYLANMISRTYLHTYAHGIYFIHECMKNTHGQTSGHNYIDLASDADQEYIYFMGSFTPTFDYIIYLTGYKKLNMDFRN